MFQNRSLCLFIPGIFGGNYVFETTLTSSHFLPINQGEIRDITVGDLLREAVADAPDRVGLKEMNLAG